MAGDYVYALYGLVPFPPHSSEQTQKREDSALEDMAHVGTEI